MRPALIYYGGKQNMLSHILPLIPKHKCYVEPFCGGATVFFAKDKSSNEILNDNNNNLINFYRILKDPIKGKQLIQMCKGTLYSRTEHNRAIKLFKTGSDIEKAWALWLKINTGFSGKLNGGFSTTKTTNSSHAMVFTNRKSDLSVIAIRLENVQVENIGALNCIKNYDSENTFHYIDPPYLGADQGHYKGYMEKDFIDLLEIISEMKGMFLLSCYPGEAVYRFIESRNWNSFSEDQRIRATNKNKKKIKKFKTEMLVWNYEIDTNTFEF